MFLLLSLSLLTVFSIPDLSGIVNTFLKSF
nr:MAG TPA: hypothetical protein [Caudoviricetes sp.]